jgi:tyrosyl-tRNA synthetase
MLERDDFKKRFDGNLPISIHEFLYPLMQGYDSVMIEADIEMGGNDQIFNILVGRTLQERKGIDPQVAFIMPLLVGTDGEKKMSKSLSNHVGITDPPRDIYGKTMSIPDNVITHWFELATGIDQELLKSYKADLESGTNPRDIKRILAHTLVEMYYDKATADSEQDWFIRQFSKKQKTEIPDDAPSVDIECDGESIWIVKVITTSGAAKSNGEAKRLIKGGGVYIDDKRVDDQDMQLAANNEYILRVGKHRFYKVKVLS